MSSTVRRLALAFALLGLAVSLEAGYVHYRMLRDPLYTSFCDVSATVSCTQAYASRFGTVAGVPVSVFGAIWFVFVLLLLLAAQLGSQVVADSITGYLFALSTVALGVVMYLAYASFFILRTLCPLCLLTYVAVVGLYVISGVAMNFPISTLPGRIGQDVRPWVASPLAIIVPVLTDATRKR